MTISNLGNSLLAALAVLPQPVGAMATARPAGQSRTLLLTPVEMFKFAEVASAKGDMTTVAAIYAALESNPNPDIRAEARFRQAKQLMKDNRNRDAAVLLRRVLDDKPDAANVRLELAHILQMLGDADAALRELRAVQSSKLPPTVARMVDRYSQALRAARPIGASFEIAIAPDSNINYATRSDALGTVFGDFEIDEDSQAKSGTGISLRGQAYRRVAIGTGEANLLFRVSGSGDLYRKSAFNSLAADFAAGPELQLGRNKLNVELGATQRWFGQKLFIRSARIGAAWTRPLGRRMQIRLNASAALVDNRFNDLQDGKTFSGQVGLERALNSTTGIAVTVGGDRQSLKEAGYSTTNWRAGVIAWRDVGRAMITIGADFGRLKADERLALFPKERSDRYSRLTIGASFRQLTFQGFAPVARFSFERNRSSIEFYDYRRTRTELGIIRAF